MKRLAYLAALTCLGTSHSFAETTYGLGIGVNAGNSLYKDIGTETGVLPIWIIQSDKFLLIGPQFSYEFATFSGLEFAFIGDYRGDGFSGSDGAIFNGMKDRSGTYELGLEIEYESDFGDFSFAVLNDVLGEHEGNEISLTYSLPFINRSSVVTPYVSLINYSEDLVDYYYGVRANEATESRAFYEGKSTVNYEIGVDTQWRFGDHHIIAANLSYTAHGSEIEDSPIVDGNGTFNTLIGYAYEF